MLCGFLGSTRGQAFQVLANPNGTLFMHHLVSSGNGKSGKEIIMVDPLEAKRLAAKEMEKIKAKERFKRQREIEAINGAWAMIGLTAGLVIEGHTGKAILPQMVAFLLTVGWILGCSCGFFPEIFLQKNS